MNIIIKKKSIINSSRSVIVFTAAIILILHSGKLPAAPSAHSIIKQMDQKLRGNTSRSRLLIIIKRRRFTRRMLIDSWENKKGNRSFTRILRPRKDRGVTFLKRGKNLWQYIPKIGKEIKIEGSLMLDSWMGSDFTNDDLMKASSIVKDYNHSFGTDTPPDTYKIILIPKPGAPVVWGKIVAIVRKKDLLPVQQNFFDHRGRNKKQMMFYDIKRMGGRIIPTRMKMFTIRRGRKISSTTMIFKRMRFNHRIRNYIFSKSNLRR